MAKYDVRRVRFASQTREVTTIRIRHVAFASLAVVLIALTNQHAAHAQGGRSRGVQGRRGEDMSWREAGWWQTDWMSQGARERRDDRLRQGAEGDQVEDGQVAATGFVLDTPMVNCSSNS